MPIEYFPLGDSALQLRFGSQIDEQTHREIYAYSQKAEHAKIPGITELVPAYTTLLIHYNPLQIGLHQLVDLLRSLEEAPARETETERKLVEIPVLYGAPFGTDIAQVLLQSGLTETELIAAHSNADYLVYMLGFTPGFCYLGGMPERLATPRKANPAARILAGSVGIAGEQTGIYPIESPGGWQIIGRTPIKLFDAEREQPFLLEAGNQVRFKSITVEEFNQLNQYHD